MGIVNSGSLRFKAVLLVAAIAGLSGCRKANDGVDTSREAASTEAPENQEAIRQMIIAEAVHYVFFEDSACVGVPDNILTTARGVIPSTLTYSGARLTDTAPHTRGRIAGRITSNAAYPPLGIVEGVNYVWRDSVGGGTRLLTVPVPGSAPLTWLTVGSAQYVPGVVEGIRCAINRSVGFCAGGCPEGHCTAEQSLRPYTGVDSATIRIHP